MNKILCIDTETGGLNPYKSALCSVTIKVVGENLIKTIYIKPTKNREYHPDAMRVNNLTFEELEERGVDEFEAADEIEKFIKEVGGFKPVFLAHNIVFDSQFLNVLFYRTKKKMFMDMMHYHPMDTMIMMKGLKETGVIDIQSVSLSNCYKYFFGENFSDAHTSRGDVIATQKVYYKIKELLQEKNK
jgi:DNA polymerase-3 subunit epsilon